MIRDPIKTAPANDARKLAAQTQSGQRCPSFVSAHYQWMVEQVNYQGWPYIVVMAIREIQVGEEILIEYGEGFWQRKKVTILFVCMF